MIVCSCIPRAATDRGAALSVCPVVLLLRAMLLLIFLPVMTNLGPQPPGMSFRIVEHGMAWETEPATQSWEEMLASESRMACWKERKQVAEWLLKVLADGERRASEVQSDAAELGFSRMTLRRAAGALERSTCQKLVDGINRGFWSLPQSLQSARTEHHEHLGAAASSVVSETQTDPLFTPERSVDSA
jgi:hypothetical protein